MLVVIILVVVVFDLSIASLDSSWCSVATCCNCNQNK